MKTLRTNTYLQQSHILFDLLALVAGALLPLAFAPVNWFWLAFVSTFAFLVSLSDCQVKRAVWRGGLFGFGFFIVGTSWVFVSIHTFGNTSIILASIITFGFTSLLGSCYALLAGVYVALQRKQHWISPILLFPCVWTLQEVFRSWFLTGFPWLLLGNSQLHTYLAGYAPLMSVYGVSFLTCLIAGLAYQAFKGGRTRFICGAIIIAIFGLGFGLGKIQWSKPNTPAIHASLIQGNIAQGMKWNPAYLDNILQRYAHLSQNEWGRQLIVWPEGAVPDLLNNQLAFFQHMKHMANHYHSALITGVPLANPKTQQFYNGAVSLGDAKGTYLKRHLVPFGEYLPLENMLRGLINFFNLPMSDFSAGPDTQTLIKVDNVNIGTYLCYEIAYLNLVLGEQPQAQLLLNISDDSWFGDSWAAAQQLQMAQMRSLETARDQLVVGNSGYTAVINSHGRVVSIAPRDKAYVLRGSVHGRTGSTPLVSIGWPIELLILLALFGLCILLTHKRKK
jgi:apolipoprotein N-acyltransferase